MDIREKEGTEPPAGGFFVYWGKEVCQLALAEIDNGFPIRSGMTSGG
jgi:hypothetical protein